jgi:hypothetical protein
MANVQQIDYGPDPITKETIVYYTHENVWSVARKTSTGSYKYMTTHYTWTPKYEKDVTAIYPTQEEAKLIIDDYCVWTTNPDSSILRPPQYSIILPPVIPHAIDRQLLHVKFRCPICSSPHISKIKTVKWDSVAKEIVRHCPKKPGEHFKIRMWDKKPLFVVVPHSPLPKLPKYDCASCYGSGEYVGFNCVHDCDVCFPKTPT